MLENLLDQRIDVLDVEVLDYELTPVAGIRSVDMREVSSLDYFLEEIAHTAEPLRLEGVNLLENAAFKRGLKHSSIHLRAYLHG